MAHKAPHSSRISVSFLRDWFIFQNCPIQIKNMQQGLLPAPSSGLFLTRILPPFSQQVFPARYSTSTGGSPIPGSPLPCRSLALTAAAASWPFTEDKVPCNYHLIPGIKLITWEAAN
ncbi:unnamed protein product [Eretmochelys imbricata]